MSGMTPVDLPQYLNFDDENTERRYQELLNLILSQWFNSNGFFQPTLSATQLNSLLAMSPVPIQNGTHWLNSTVNKMQFLDNTGTVQTITSA